MKKNLYSCVIVLCMLLQSLSLFATAPTIPASNVNFSFIDGGTIRVNFTTGNGAQRLVIAKLGGPVTALPVNGTDYLSNSIFGQGFQIAPGEYVVGKTLFGNVDISGLQPSSSYHFAVFEFNGSGASTEYLMTPATGIGTTVSAPTIQATNVTISNIIGNSMTINWTNGNGAKRIVLMKKTLAVDVNPVDLTNYNPTSQFGLGVQIGSGNYVVYNSIGNSVTVSNLDPSTVYHVAVFEANGSITPVFLTTSPARGNATTLPRPTIPATGASMSFIETITMRLSWTPGNGTRRIVVARANQPVDAVPVDGVDYLAGTSASFATAPEITTGQKVVYDFSGFLTDMSGFTLGTTYYFRVYEYDGSGTSIGYLTSNPATASGTTLAKPTVQASNLTFSNITATSMQLNWTNGNGSRRIVLAKAGGAVDMAPVDLVSYNANPFFGNGAQLGSGNYVVYNSGGNSVNVTGLSANVTYNFAIFEANGQTDPVYLTVLPAVGSQATSNRPTVPSSGLSISSIEGSSMQLSWTSGNGARRIIVVRAGSAVDAIPADGVDYLAGASAPFSTAPEITPGQKVVYDNTTASASVTGLNPATTYYFRIYEYDGTGAQIRYLTALFVAGNANTVSAPTTQASNIVFSNITSSSVQLNWTNGNGVRRLVIAKAGSAVDAVPTDLVSYGGNTNFGSGTAITPGNYVVYSSNGSSATVSNLTLNTNYHFAVYEYNGSAEPVYYTINPARNNITTAAQPTIPSSGLTFGSFEGNAIQLFWSPGNGTHRIVVARAGGPVDAVPVNGVDYLAGVTAPFNTAPEISPGQKVIYDNTSNIVNITGLNPSTTYYFRIYEYDGTGSSIGYLTTSFGSGSSSTVSDPTVQASSVSFTSVTSNSMNISCTNGNGTGRIILVRQGAPVTNDPVDLSTYSANNGFGSGSQVGAGNYVVYNSASNSVNVTSLTAGTTYYVAVYEYNGSQAPMYLTPSATGQGTTVGPPAVQATNGNSSGITNTSVQLNWTNGSGNRRIVLMRKGGAVNAAPANNIHYFGNSFFGSGAVLNVDNYVVFDGIQNSVTVTNLQANNTYHFAVFEYNDFGATTQVLTTNPARGNFNTVVLPVVLIEFKATVQKEYIQLSWATAQEQNSDYFSVERSSDGISFSEKARLQAKGQSTVHTDYSFRDNTPFEEDNYYRLKQVDRDGTTTYSFILHVKFNSGRLIRKMATIVSNRLVIDFFKQPSGTDYFIIYDMSGRLVRREVLALHTDTDVASFAPGIYVVEIHTQLRTEKVKVVKQ